MHADRIRVLLIEDDAIDQLAFKRLVEAKTLPYSYTIAGSVAEARSIISKGGFDIIISDYSLGDGTAFDAIDFRLHAPVIMITGVGNEEVAVTAMKKGAYDYLSKDLERNYLNMLPLTVENTIKRKRTEDEKEQLIVDLRKALSKIRKLSGMLPICASCQNIRDDKGYWSQVADYMSERTNAKFTHGLCPGCAEKLYGDHLSNSNQTPSEQAPE